MRNLTLIILLLPLILLNSCSSDDDTGDTERPTTPLNLIASNITDTSLELSWNASSDNVSVSGYRIIEEISGVITQVAASSTTYLMNGLTPETSYKYKVIAVDAAGNESAPSNSVEVTTAMAPLEFATNLSEMGVFAGDLGDLIPATGVQLYELYLLHLQF